MKTSCILPTLLMSLLSLNACVRTYVSLPGDVTVEDRIARNPKFYEELSPKDQQMVRAGQLRKGMKPSEVRMAWGSPDLVHGAEDDLRNQTWYYGSPNGGPYYVKREGGSPHYTYPSYGGRGDIEWRPSKSGNRFGYVEIKNGEVSNWEESYPSSATDADADQIEEAITRMMGPDRAR